MDPENVINLPSFLSQVKIIFIDFFILEYFVGINFCGSGATLENISFIIVSIDIRLRLSDDNETSLFVDFFLVPMAFKRFNTTQCNQVNETKSVE